MIPPPRTPSLPLFLLLLLTLTVACICAKSPSFATLPSQTPREIHTGGTQVAVTPTFPPAPHPLAVADILESPIPGDSRVWVALQSGQIIESHDAARSWYAPYPPPPYEAECFRVVPITAGGLYCFGAWGLVALIQDDGWIEIEPPLPSNVTEIVAAPDGTGRLIAVGGDPNSRANLWLRDASAEADWQSISVPVDNFASIETAFWIPGEGLWAYNSAGSLIHFQDSFTKWEVLTDFGDESPYRSWVSSDGSMRVYTGLAGDFRVWDGSTWAPLDIGNAWDALRGYPPPVTVMPGRAEFARADTDSGYARSHDGGITWEPLSRPPGLPDRVSINDLAVSGNSLLLATAMGIYISDDLGDSWRAIQTPPLSRLTTR